MVQDVSASSITQSANDPIPVAKLAVHGKAITRRVVVGTFLGFAWGASLRAWMAVLAVEFGQRPQFTWEGTFGAILLPAALMGALLGGATDFAQTSHSTRWRWAILSPLLLIVGPLIFLRDFIPSVVTTGLGGGAIGVALIGLLGGYAFSGYGVRWTRWAASLFPSLFFIIAPLYAFYSVVNGTLNVGGFFSVVLFVLLMALLIAGISAPARYWANQRTLD